MTLTRVPLVLDPRSARLAADGAPGLVLVLPGGGYANRAEHEGPVVTDWLTARGVPAAHLEYPVAPARHPEALDQVLLALADLRGGAHGSFSGPVALLGFSAGGHLAGTAATATAAELAELASRAAGDGVALRRPDLVSLAYPVVSFVESAHLGSRLNLLGEVDDARAAELSVDRRVDAATPPAFLWHTADDDAVPVANSLLLARALGSAGVPYELHVYPSGRHGLGLGADVGPPVSEWPTSWLAWLARNGIGRPHLPAAPSASGRRAP